MANLDSSCLIQTYLDQWTSRPRPWKPGHGYESRFLGTSCDLCKQSTSVDEVISWPLVMSLFVYDDGKNSTHRSHEIIPADAKPFQPRIETAGRSYDLGAVVYYGQ